MTVITKKRKESILNYDKTKAYNIDEGVEVLKKIRIAKFDPSINVDIRLNVDPRKPNQMIRGVVNLPHGNGKKIKILVLCTPDKIEEAKESGADYFGLDEYIEKIKNGWHDIDIIITQPSIMPKIGSLGKILGPHGLMPNPKSGTVTTDIGEVVNEVKKGKTEFKVDKNGIVHLSIGKLSFDNKNIIENYKELLSIIHKLKPNSLKGIYIKSIYISSTMSPSIQLENK